VPARRIDDTKKAHILALHGQGLGCKAIAREAGVSPSTVSKVCNEAGLTFDRSKTEVATKALVADAKHRRAELAEHLLDDADRLRRQLWEPAKAFSFGGRDNTYNEVELDKPTFADQLKILQAVDVASRRHQSLVEMDAGRGATEAESVLDRLEAGFAEYAQQNPEGQQGG
jgi:AraC-like DNA-binding protein